MRTIDLVQQVLLRSGTAWILWLLGALSVASLAIAVERWFVLRARGCEPHTLAMKLRVHLARRDFAAAAQELRGSTSSAAAIAAAGLELAALGPDAAEKAMQSAVALERGRLERWLAYLATVGNNAPFLGLFGTVIGVIGAFEELGRSGAVPASVTGAVTGAGAQVASQAVMSSIAEALVATAVGIFVALPAVAAFNYFQRRIASLLLATDVLANLVIAYLSDARVGQPVPTEGRDE